MQVTLIPGDGIGPSIANATVRLLARRGRGHRVGYAGCRHGRRRARRRSDSRSDDRFDQAHASSPSRARSRRRSARAFARSTSRCARHSTSTPTCVRRTRSRRAAATRTSTSCSCARTPKDFYVGIEHYIAIGDDPRAAAESIAIITREGSERIVRYAFEYAVKHNRKKVTLVHKANILKFSQGLFLDTGRMVARDYAGTIEFEERIVDAMAMNLVLHPEKFDVIVTTNLFGDILSDQISGLVGGLGLAPGANIGVGGAIFEAVHGTAPDIAGKGIANPGAVMLAACMLLDHIGDGERANRIRTRVRERP